jgi:hypothetical protein
MLSHEPERACTAAICRVAATSEPCGRKGTERDEIEGRRGLGTFIRTTTISVK